MNTTITSKKKTKEKLFYNSTAFHRYYITKSLFFQENFKIKSQIQVQKKKQVIRPACDIIDYLKKLASEHLCQVCLALARQTLQSSTLRVGLLIVGVAGLRTAKEKTKKPHRKGVVSLLCS